MAKSNLLTRRSFVKFAASAVPAYKLGSLSSLGLTRNQSAITFICPPCGLNCDTREFDKPGACPVCGMTLIDKQEIKPGEQVSIEKFMEFYKIPGLSLAIIDNFKLAATKTYGVTEAGGTTPVTTRTLFQAGSISKPVATLGALHLVEPLKRHAPVTVLVHTHVVIVVPRQMLAAPLGIDVAAPMIAAVLREQVPRGQRVERRDRKQRRVRESDQREADRFARLRGRAPHRTFEVRIVAAVAAHFLMMRVEVKREHAALVAAEPVQQVTMRGPLAIREARDRERQRSG